MNVVGDGGWYTLTFNDAIKECAARNLVLATYDDVHAAWDSGLSLCSYGWVSDRLNVIALHDSTYCLNGVVGFNTGSLPSVTNAYCKYP